MHQTLYHALWRISRQTTIEPEPASGHRADGRGLRRDFSAIYVIDEPQTRLFWD
jgi:hypothetical protein